jgi:hypothetical protein
MFDCNNLNARFIFGKHSATDKIIACKDQDRLRVFENRVLRRIFGPMRDEVAGGRRKLHNKKLHNMYSSPSIIRMMKSRRMRWAGHTARMGDEDECI